MSDKVGGYRTKHREDRRRHRREKENHGEEREKLQVDPEYRHICHRVEGESVPDDESVEYSEEKEGDEPENHRKPEKFPDEDRRPTNRFRKEEIDRASFDLSVEHPASKKQDDEEPGEFDEGKPEVIEHSLDFPKGQGSQEERNQEKYNSEEDNQGEKLIAYDLTEGIEGDIPHNKGGIRSEVDWLISWYAGWWKEWRVETIETK